MVYDAQLFDLLSYLCVIKRVALYDDVLRYKENFLSLLYILPRVESSVKILSILSKLYFSYLNTIADEPL